MYHTHIDLIYTLGLGAAVIAIGQTIRLGASVLSVLGTQFSTKERLFIAMARFPKATVQVSIYYLTLIEKRVQQSNVVSFLRNIYLELPFIHRQLLEGWRWIWRSLTTIQSS